MQLTLTKKRFEDFRSYLHFHCSRLRTFPFVSSKNARVLNTSQTAQGLAPYQAQEVQDRMGR